MISELRFCCIYQYVGDVLEREREHIDSFFKTQSHTETYYLYKAGEGGTGHKSLQFSKCNMRRQTRRGDGALLVSYISGFGSLPVRW